MRVIKPFSILIFLFLLVQQAQAQVVLEQETDIELDYLNPVEYEIGGITFSGTAECDLRNLPIAVSERIKIPGDKIHKTIERLSKMGIYKDNIQISAKRIEGKIIFLDIYLEEMPRLSTFIYRGVKKSDIDEFDKKVKLSQGKVVNENLKTIVKNVVGDYYREKGFYHVQVDVSERKDTLLPNFLTLIVEVNKGKKVKVNGINIVGAEKVDAITLRRAMKETKTRFLFQPFEKIDTAVVDFVKNHKKYKEKDLWQLTSTYFADRVRVRFKTSKFDRADYESDKESMIQKYNALGHRDAYIVSDSVYFLPDGSMNIDIVVDEGQKYYFRNITWVGNTKYSSEVLSQVLGIRKGDVYNTALLETNLTMSQENLDVSSLYLDDGYLFFNAIPVEIAVVEDSVDVEIRIREGSQARIRRVDIINNTRTSDIVALRELSTIPGRMFSRSDIIRSQRQLMQLGFFNPEKMNVIPKADEKTGMVDLEYIVEEASSDQLQLSLGWGGGYIYGNVGFNFNNFSARKFFKKGAWTPIPSGDGQRLGFMVQVYSNMYQQYSASFTEPWLGGKKPIALTVGASQSLYASSNAARSDANYVGIQITTASVGVMNRLKIPDDYFYMSNTIMYQYYNVSNYSTFRLFSNGESHAISYIFGLGRNSTDAPIYTRTGSDIAFSIQLTPPYSLFNNKNYNDMTDQQRYKFLEYYKWKFNIKQYINIIDNLVLSLRGRFGYLGMYNSKAGASPFERFYLGGSGLTATSILDGREIIGMRGYTDAALSSDDGGTIFQKFTFELRYPVSLNPSATVYLLGFLETGNSWETMKDYQPFKMYRAAGFGVRVFLPMFGLLGLDWGYGFDPVPGNPSAHKSQFHFTMGAAID
ncbi:MAG: BamA/TamA family outer membrane protein [Lentimicrobiaceae bacterium]|nr:BamA/TamA family outer membrane protein [Lentimicrobiaceae bacterium]